MWSSLNAWLWQDRLWLPPNFTWADLQDREDLVFPRLQDLLPALPLGLLLVALRMTFERFVGLPLSRWAGVKDAMKRQVKPSHVLETYFLRTGKRPEEPQMALLAAQCGLTLRQTQHWFRRRRNQDRPLLSKKFCEANWRFLFYLHSFIFGILNLYHEPWLWNLALCWENYPFQDLKPGLYWWYLLQLSFYISLLITLPFDTKRKDSKEQVLHHLVTIGLLVFSYTLNLVRIGGLVVLLHDCSDFLLEACKMLNYTRCSTACDALFVTFSLVFFYTRLVLFPTRILHTTWYDSIKTCSPFFGYYFFNALLAMLQLLHVYWSCLIGRMIYSFLKKGQMEKDIRSDVEESDSSNDEAAPTTPQLNGVTRGPGAAPADGPRSRAAGRLANGHVLAT